MRTTLILLLAVTALAGCGSSGGPPIEKTLAAKLAREADAIAAARNACSAGTRARILQRQTIAAINAGKIPAAYQETLQSRVNEIATALDLRCLPTPAPASAASSAPRVVTSAPPRGRGHGKRHKGKHGKEGD